MPKLNFSAAMIRLASSIDEVGLGDERKIVFIADFEPGDIGGRLDKMHPALRLAHRALDLGMPVMADHCESYLMKGG